MILLTFKEALILVFVMTAFSVLGSFYLTSSNFNRSKNCRAKIRNGKADHDSASEPSTDK